MYCKFEWVVKSNVTHAAFIALGPVGTYLHVLKLDDRKYRVAHNYVPHFNTQ